MGRIVVSEFVSLDGVVQDPDGKEGFRAGGWVGPLKTLEEVAEVKLDEALGADALLLGRRSYEFFATRWGPRRGELADRLNGLPKYVVSSTLNDPRWSNTTVVGNDATSEIATLREAADGDLLVYASFELVRTLLEHDLVDELRLMVFPVVLGAGVRLFGETSERLPFRLVGSRTVEDDIAFLTYECHPSRPG
jgi:dihydrofolate reductase